MLKWMKNISVFKNEVFVIINNKILKYVFKKYKLFKYRYLVLITYLTHRWLIIVFLLMRIKITVILLHNFKKMITLLNNFVFKFCFQLHPPMSFGFATVHHHSLFFTKRNFSLINSSIETKSKINFCAKQTQVYCQLQVSLRKQIIYIYILKKRLF